MGTIDPLSLSLIRAKIPSYSLIITVTVVIMAICCLFPPRSSGGIWRVFDGPVVETIWRGARKSTPFWLAVTVKHRFEIVLAALPSFPSGAGIGKR